MRGLAGAAYGSPMCRVWAISMIIEVVFEKPSAEQVQLMMASNDIVSTVMYWILWDLADCPLVSERIETARSGGSGGSGGSWYRGLRI